MSFPHLLRAHTKHLMFCFLTVLCLLGSTASAYAYVADGTSWWNTKYRTTEGTEFWLNYMNNAGKAKGQQDLHLRLFATAREAAHVCVFFNTDTLAGSWTPSDSVTFDVPASGMAGLDNATAVDNLYAYLEDASDMHKSVYVTSTSPISLYALNYADNSFDATNVLPINALGKEHVIQSYTDAEFSITSPYDRNQVTIQVYEDNVFVQTITRTMGRGDTYIHFASSGSVDLSGTTICSTKPIMVMQGGKNAVVPMSDQQQCHVFAQNYSTDKWGRHFVVPRTGNQNKDVVLITAAEANTEIRRDGALVQTLGQGETYRMEIDWYAQTASALSFITSKSATCQLLQTGFDSNDETNLGSPALMPIIPLELSLRTLVCSNYEFEKDLQEGFSYQKEFYYITIVVPTDGTASMLIDGVQVNQSLFQPAGISWRGRDYSFAIVRVAAGAHQLDNADYSFVSYNYGLSRYQQPQTISSIRPRESYAYSAGSRVERSADMVIDSAYVWHKSVCVTDEGIQFSSLINYDFDSIRWVFPKNSGNVVSSEPYLGGQGDSTVVYKFKHRYTEGNKVGVKKNNVPDNDTVMMIINRTTPICQFQIKDTIKVLIQVGDTFSVHENFEHRPDSVICVDEPMRIRFWNDSCQCEDTVTIFTDTLNSQWFNGQELHFDPGKPYFLDDNLKTHMVDIEGNPFECDSIIHQHFIIQKASSDAHVAEICIKDLPYETVLRHRWKGAHLYQDAEGDWHKDTVIRTAVDTIRFDLTQAQKDSLTAINADTTFSWTRHFETINFCDSSTKVIVHVSPSYRFEEWATACLDSAGSYSWHRWDTHSGREQLYRVDSVGRVNIDRIPLDSAGEFLYEIPYVATCLKCNNCDSTYALHLTVREQYYLDTTRTLCSNDTIHWKDSVYMGPDYADRRPEYFAVDASTTLHYNETSVLYGCDSIVDFHICLAPAYITPDSITVAHICTGQSYTFTDSTYSWTLTGDTVESFLLTDTVPTQMACFEDYHCDSVIAHLVYVHPIKRDTVRMHHCFTDSARIEWEGHSGPLFWEEGNATVDSILLTEPGEYTYVDTLKSCLYCDQGGCDSIVVLKLTAGLIYHTELKDTVCSWSLPYEWVVGGDTIELSRSGEYRDTLQTVAGCDSTFTLQLHVLMEDYHEDVFDTVCSNMGFFQFGDTLIDLSLLPTDTISDFTQMIDFGACSYPQYLHLRVYPAYDQQFTDTVCQLTDGRYTWAGHTGRNIWNADADSLMASADIDISEAGLYHFTDSLITASHGDVAGGCDSVWHLTLLVAPSYAITDTVRICGSDSVSWQGKLYTGSEFVAYGNTYPTTAYSRGIDSLLTAGVYLDTVRYQTALFGCDSLHLLRLEVGEVVRLSLDTTACQNEELFYRYWNNGLGADLPTADTGLFVFSDTVQNVQTGCDSIITLTLSVNPIYLFVQDTTVCQNPDYPDWTWTNAFGDSLMTVSIADSGRFVIYDSLQTAVGCDSVFRLNLRVSPVYRFDSVYTICQNERITWMGRSYCGDHYGSSLTILPTSSPDRHQDKITYSPYEGDAVLSAGWHYDTIRYQTELDGCDSIYYLQLLVLPQYDVVVDEDACDRDGFRIFEGGDTHGHTYRDSIAFDPILRMRDSINKDTLFFERIYRLQSVDGCDSIVYRHLTVHPSYEFQYTYHKCSDEVFTWRGRDYYEEGVYTDPFQTRNWGCDSTYVLYLFVKPVVIVKIDTTICDNETLYHYNRLYRPDGTFVEDTTVVWSPGNEPNRTYNWQLRYNSGCDSIIYQYFVRTRPTFLVRDTVSLCSNEEYTNDRYGHTWASYLHEYEPGQYVLPFDTLIRETYQAVNTCDSSYFLHAHISPAYRHVDMDTICSNGQIRWRDHTYEDLLPGEHIFFDSLQTVNGCDSLYEFRLTVQPAYYTLTYDTICDNGQYAFGERMLTEAGFYYDSLQTVAGCDSVFHLYLTVMPTTADTLFDTICVGDTLYLHGVPLTLPGTYKDTVLNEWGCQHYTVLHLEVEEPTVMHIEIPVLCADDKTVQINYTYEGRAPISFSVFFDEAAHQRGFVDLTDVPLDDDGSLTASVPMPAGDELPMPSRPYFNTQGTASGYVNTPHLEYPEPGTYSVRISWDNGVCRNARIENDTTFLVRYPSWIHEQHWNDAVVLFTSQYNGGYEWSHIQWMRNGVDIPGETREYLYLPHFLYTSADDCILMDTLVQYSARLTRADDSVTVETCPIIPVQTYDQIVPTDFYYAVVPTLVPIVMHKINILCNVSGRYSVYTELGRQVASGSFEPCTAGHYAQEVELPLSQGTYYVLLDAGDYGRRTVPIIVTP